MPEALPAWHYDGESALRRNVTVALEGGSLRIAETGEQVPLADLRAMGNPDAAVFGLAGREGWRLVIHGTLPPDWAARLPAQERHGGLIDRIGIAPSLLLGAAFAALLVLALVQATSLVARLVPESWELRFGDALAGDLGGNACRSPAGARALASLTAKLSPPDRPVRVRVVDLPLVNAVTLPGRQVVLFRGLLAAAHSPDEIAGVLGHELGHVENRDVIRALLRDFGVGLLIGNADGGQITRMLLSSRYSRAAERAADAHAIAALARTDISPADTARFFDRLGRAERDLGSAAAPLVYVSSHPLSDERRSAFLASARRAPPYRAALSAEEWTALRGICGTAGR